MHLRVFGINLIGKQHSALCDARNLTLLAHAMIEQDFQIRNYTASISGFFFDDDSNK